MRTISLGFLLFSVVTFVNASGTEADSLAYEQHHQDAAAPVKVQGRKPVPPKSVYAPVILSQVLTPETPSSAATKQ